MFSVIASTILFLAFTAHGKPLRFQITYKAGPFRPKYYDAYYMPRTSEKIITAFHSLILNVNDFNVDKPDAQWKKKIVAQIDYDVPAATERPLRVIKELDYTPASFVILADEGCTARYPKAPWKKPKYFNIKCAGTENGVRVYIATQRAQGSIRYDLNERDDDDDSDNVHSTPRLVLPFFTLVMEKEGYSTAPMAVSVEAASVEEMTDGSTYETCFGPPDNQLLCLQRDSRALQRVTPIEQYPGEVDVTNPVVLGYTTKHRPFAWWNTAIPSAVEPGNALSVQYKQGYVVDIRVRDRRARFLCATVKETTHPMGSEVRDEYEYCLHIFAGRRDAQLRNFGYVDHKFHTIRRLKLHIGKYAPGKK